MCIYIYIYVYTYMCVYIYIHIYIHTYAICAEVGQNGAGKSTVLELLAGFPDSETFGVRERER